MKILKLVLCFLLIGSLAFGAGKSTAPITYSAKASKVDPSDWNAAIPSWLSSVSGSTPTTIGDFAVTGEVWIGATPATSYSSLIVGDGVGNESMTLYSGNSSYASLYFGDGLNSSAEYQGFIRYHHSDNDMYFATSASERMRITTEGYVGIGCTPAQAGLEIDGNSNTSALKIYGADAANEYANFYVDASNDLCIDSTGITNIKDAAMRLGAGAPGGTMYCSSNNGFLKFCGSDSAGDGGTLTVYGSAGGNKWALAVAADPQDLAPGACTITGAPAKATAVTNLDGGDIQITGGAGASSSAGDADGGNVKIDGGANYGTGSAGDIILGSTRGNVVISDSRTVSLDPAPASDHNCTGTITTGTAGENLVFGDVVYYKSDGKYWKAQGNAAATMPGVAMAIATIAGDASGNFLIQGFVRDDSWAFTVGAIVWVDDDTAGLATTTQPPDAGDQVQAIGHATGADYMYFNPEYTIVERT